MWSKTEHHIELYRLVIEALEQLGYQAVVSLGGNKEFINNVSCNNSTTKVYNYIDQYEAIKQSDLVITHAGMNTVLESLTLGKPILAIPIMGDQSNIAARIKYLQLGDYIHPKSINQTLIKDSINGIIESEKIKNNLKFFVDSCSSINLSKELNSWEASN